MVSLHASMIPVFCWKGDEQFLSRTVLVVFIENFPSSICHGILTQPNPGYRCGRLRFQPQRQPDVGKSRVSVSGDSHLEHDV